MEILKKENLIRIGFVNKTSGFHGSLNCVTDITHPEKLLKRKFFFLILDGLPVPFAIESVELKGDGLIVKFEDVDSELEAKKLLRKEIYADKIKGKKKEEILSWKDLVGFSVIDSDKGDIGLIAEVFELPMQMIAKCFYKEKEILFPLNDDIITEIDEDGKILFVELPDGLLDVYME